MPLLDIATPQPSFRNQLYSIWSQRVSFLLSNNDSTTRLGRCFHMANRGAFETCRHMIMIKAVATLEPTSCFQPHHQQQQLGNDSSTSPPNQSSSSSSSSEDLNEREKLRRMRISKANKGNTPWNKGRKHSPETLQRIRERTRIAMQDPKVKMKLVNLGHAQSDETRTKIGVSVRLGWERRREKQMMQETCHFEWLNLIAEASRKGLSSGEEELQWDSYNIMDQQLKKEWIESVEQRKKSTPKGNKRAPKSPEQRRKISEAIAAKWADPSYRNRVYSGLSKYHGTSVGIAKPRRRDRTTKKIKDLDNKSKRLVSSKPKKSNTPMYKDPQAKSKLEMIKSIRARRAASDTARIEAIARARVMIGEAERAADALEAAAAKNPIAQASLVETRKLIAEAIRSIRSIDTVVSTIQTDSAKSEDLTKMGYNGVRAPGLSDEEIMEFGFSKQDDDDDDDVISDDHVLVNGKELIHHLSASSFDLGLLPLEMNCFENEADGGFEKISTSEVESEKQETRPNTRTKARRWVCGKLVEDD